MFSINEKAEPRRCEGREENAKCFYHSASRSLRALRTFAVNTQPFNTKDHISIGVWFSLLVLLVLLAGCVPALGAQRGVDWTPEELAAIDTLWIGNLPPPPADPSNRWADDPRAAALGRKIFFDARFSANGQVSCASCHIPEAGFIDRLPRGQGVALSRRRTMSLAPAAYAPFLFWDGRKDSLWSQALEPLEDPAEHGIDREIATQLIVEHYAEEYQAVFGELPELSLPPSSSFEDGGRDWVVFANLGKAVAAYERTLRPTPSRFDRYAEALRAGAASDVLTPEEQAGLRLFIGEARCITCHNGPLLTDHAFHNTGVPLAPGEEIDRGRMEAIDKLLADPFNCLGPYSDAAPDQCGELRFMQTEGPELEAAFKPASLRGIANSAPYMHNGVFKTLEEVVQHYNRAPLAAAGRSELIPLRLSARQREQLTAFLRTLDGTLVEP